MTAMALAACMCLASLAAGGDLSSGSDVYWHTRETCFEMTKQYAFQTKGALCFTWPQVLQCVKECSSMDKDELAAAAGDLWDLTMHPTILVGVVHNH